MVFEGPYPIQTQNSKVLERTMKGFKKQYGNTCLCWYLDKVPRVCGRRCCVCGNPPTSPERHSMFSIYKFKNTELEAYHRCRRAAEAAAALAEAAAALAATQHDQHNEYDRWETDGGAIR